MAIISSFRAVATNPVGVETNTINTTDLETITAVQAADDSTVYEEVDLNGVAESDREQDENKVAFYGQTIKFVLGGSDSTAPILVEGACSVILTTTGTAKFYTTDDDFSHEEEMTFAGQVQTATATKAGIVSGDVMPRWLVVKDTSGSANTCELWIGPKRPWE